MNEAWMEQRRQDFNRGKLEGLSQGTFIALCNLMKNMPITEKQAMDYLEIPEENRALYKEQLRKQRS